MRPRRRHLEPSIQLPGRRAVGRRFAGLVAGLGLLAAGLAPMPARANLLSRIQAPASSERQPVPIEAFFEVLHDYGSWIESDRFGTLWCPHPDLVGAEFQPYARGHWVMTEAGWAFVSNLKFSWVTDHYGRWVEAGLQNCGWAWVPGGEWRPAWVEFRVSDKVIAWRPMPYSGPRVQMRVPPGVRLPQYNLPAPTYSSDSGFVAVPDGEFTFRRIENVALSGSQLYQALRETEPLRDVRAGLHSVERDLIAERVLARRNALAGVNGGPAGSGGSSGSSVGAGSGSLPGGAPPEPARRRGKGVLAGGAAPAGAPGAAGTVRAGLPGPDVPPAGREKLGVGGQPGDNPPGRTNMTTGSSAGNTGDFKGAKLLDWGKQDEPKKPKPRTLPGFQSGTPPAQEPLNPAALPAKK